MHTVHRTVIAAPVETVFALARDVEGWPDLLPDYRWCRVLERAPQRLVFAMGGRIRGWPARWVAVQEADPARGRITFRHIGGLTTGMRVEWRLAPAGSAVAVEIVHDLVLRWPLVGRWVSDLIVGPIFIDHIARRTLAAVKARAEALARRAPDGASTAANARPPGGRRAGDEASPLASSVPRQAPGPQQACPPGSHQASPPRPPGTMGPTGG